MSTHELPAPAVKLMIDLSTSHMTAKDNTLCRTFEKSSAFITTPRIVEHGYGYIVFVTSDPEAVHHLFGLREMGFSEPFIDIYQRAATSENTIMLINFDADADPIDELPSFN